MKYKVGDLVETKYGKGKIEEIKDGRYLVYHFYWRTGHNAGLSAEKEYYGSHCWWFDKDEELTLINSKSFTKSDLQEGDVVTTREGKKDIFHDGDFIEYDIDCYNDDLTDVDSDKEYDIVRVERPTKIQTVFEREEEPTEITISEIKEKFGITGILKIKEDE